MERRDFFISYTKQDKDWALWIANALIACGYTVYMQEMDIFPGDSFITKMNYFLENSENFISVWSKAYNGSYYGMMELESAVTAKMRIIFCCVDTHPVQKLFRRLVHVSLSDRSAESEKKLVNAVLRAVPRSIPTPKPEPPKSEDSPKSKPSKPVVRDFHKLRFSLIGLFLAITLLFVVAYGIRTLWKENSAATQEPTAVELYQTGYNYHHGINGIDVDYAKARDYYQRAAEKGFVSALSQLGWLYDNGLGVDVDYAKALDYYQQAAEKGDPVGLYNLGWLYEYGKGVEKDSEKAKDYYKKSARAGNEEVSKVDTETVE